MNMKKFITCAAVAAMLAMTLTGCTEEDWEEIDDLVDEIDEGLNDINEDLDDVSETLDGIGDYDGSYSDYSAYDDKKYGGKLGSAKELDGTTVVVSVFADDTETSWDNDDENKYKTLEYLGIATDWISDNCARYGADAEFIYDWTQYEDLYYTTEFNYDMTKDEEEPYYAENDYVEQSVDSEGLMEKYNADNIIYMLYFNNDYSCSTASATYAYVDEDTADYPYEIVNIFTRCDGMDENPASYAHEILHTFGAPDFYKADTDGQNYGITQDFVDYNDENYSNDIMYTTFDAETSDPYYDKITNDFTDLVAYYVGLISECSDVDEWGLGESQH